MTSARGITVLATLLVAATPLRAEGPRSPAPNPEKTTSEPRQSATAGIGPAEVAKVGAAAAKVWPAVMIIGHPERGYGAGFVISRQHRLVATAAHVADEFSQGGYLLAVSNGSVNTYQVERVWYHPELRRELDDGFAVRSPDPADGPISVHGPDVAVLRLSEYGKPLPPEVEMAGREELDRMTDAPIGLLGYPGDERSLDGESPVGASLQFGRVIGLDARPSGLDRSPDAPRIVKHTASSGAGTSGGPVFLANGHVAAVHYAYHRDGYEKAVRIDAIWELLAYHGLDDLVPIPGGRGDFRFPTGPARDPKLSEYREAVRLVKKAKWLTARRDFKGAGACCNQAIRLAPDYAGAYARRVIVRTHYIGDRIGRAATAELRRQKAHIVSSAKIIDNKFKNYFDTEYLYALEQAALYFVVMERPTTDLDNYRRWLREQLEKAEKSLELELEDVDHGRLLGLRAQIYDLLGDQKRALDDYDEAIRLSPEDDNLYGNRARLRERLGRPDLAAQDRMTGDQLRRRWSAIPPEIDRPAVASSSPAEANPPGPLAIPELPPEPPGSLFDLPARSSPAGPSPASARGGPHGPGRPEIREGRN